MLYKVAITETLRRIVTVEARSPSEAHRRVSDAYHNGEVRLDPEHFDGVEFYVTDEPIAPKESIMTIERKN